MDTNGIIWEALGDGTRRRIFERLRPGPRSVGELAEGLPVSRPAVSQHLRVLKQAGLVSDSKAGTRRLYRVDPGGLLAIRDYVEGFWSEALERFREEAGREHPMSTATTETIRKSIVVDLVPAEAFELFTAGVASWWPTKTHSYSGEAVRDVVFEPGVGGSLHEVTDEGRAEWGRVLTWEPPERFVLEWRIGNCAGTEVEVRFTPDGPGSRVELEHRGWERLEDPSGRDNYSGGWDGVLAPFVEAGTH